MKKDEQIKRLQEENLQLRKELVVQDGKTDITIEQRPFTKLIAAWALECFKQNPNAINYIALTFKSEGELYELMLKRRKALGPELVIELKQQLKEKDEAIKDLQENLAKSVEIDIKRVGEINKLQEQLDTYTFLGVKNVREIAGEYEVGEALIDASMRDYKFKKLKVTLEFKIQDFWIGAYWKSEKNVFNCEKIFHLYLCLIPCFPLHIQIVKGKDHK